MELSFEQIRSAVNGIIRTEENELGLELHRFSREQESFFYKTHPVFCHDSFFNGFFGRNCRTCAGVTLDFISDAKIFRIEFRKIEYPENKKEQLFDLYVDNQFVQSYDLFTDEIVYSGLEKTHQITLYFPPFAFPIVSSVTLEDATVFLPQKKPVEVLFLGDSITHGARASHPANTYVMHVARKLNVSILNQGNSGFVYDAGSIEKVCEPKVIVTAYGINDIMRKNMQQLEEDTITFLIKLKEVYKNAKIVSILPLWTYSKLRDADYKKAEWECLQKIYECYSDYMIDGRNSLIPYDKKLLDDGVHPNDEGFRFYGENLARELAGII